MNMDSYAVCSVDDLLDLPSDEFFSATANPNANAATGSLLGSPSPSAAGTFLAPGCSSDVNDFICVPNDDAAELEWLSNYMDDSITDLPADELPAAVNFHSSGFVAGFHGRARSKRSHPTATENPMANGGGGVAMKAENLAEARRRCTHCASEKTPQWRTGPLGPKTLCNACGVRYKSGRLVPEYRPAASPTFMLTQHSNSHRKVLELRRQKDLLRHQHQSLRQPNSDSEGYSCHSGIC